MIITQQDAEVVIAVALDAAGLVQRMRRSGGLEVKSKSNDIDLVTAADVACEHFIRCLLYTSPSPRDRTRSRMPSSA